MVGKLDFSAEPSPRDFHVQIPACDDGADFDRVAEGVVHLEGIGREVAHAEAQARLLGKRVSPMEAALADAAGVAAEEGEDLGLVGLHDEEAAHAEAGQEEN